MRYVFSKWFKCFKTRIFGKLFEGLFRLLPEDVWWFSKNKCFDKCMDDKAWLSTRAIFPADGQGEGRVSQSELIDGSTCCLLTDTIDEMMDASFRQKPFCRLQNALAPPISFDERRRQPNIIDSEFTLPYTRIEIENETLQQGLWSKNEGEISFSLSGKRCGRLRH